MDTESEAKLQVPGPFWRLLSETKPGLHSGRPWIYQDPERQTARLNDKVKALRDELADIEGFSLAQVQLDWFEVRVQHEDPEVVLQAGTDCLPIAKRYADFLNAVVYVEAFAEIDELFSAEDNPSVPDSSLRVVHRRLHHNCIGSIDQLRAHTSEDMLNLGFLNEDIDTIVYVLGGRGLKLAGE
ncbi:hypothetical protein HYX70_00855 [Candidatus Saccharibacteria bacterium]|nr:hypothetical protein [Candidatus Saccharibacteria bacterium]